MKRTPKARICNYCHAEVFRLTKQHLSGACADNEGITPQTHEAPLRVAEEGTKTCPGCQQPFKRLRKTGFCGACSTTLPTQSPVEPVQRLLNHQVGESVALTLRELLLLVDGLDLDLQVRIKPPCCPIRYAVRRIKQDKDGVLVLDGGYVEEVEDEVDE